jgi:hypothetical protein
MPLRIFCRVGLLVAVRQHLRLGVATAALQPQRGCVIQPSVGAKRLRWVNGQNENNSEGVVAMVGGGDATPSALKTFWGT